jgi:hypothetical protein
MEGRHDDTGCTRDARRGVGRGANGWVEGYRLGRKAHKRWASYTLCRRMVQVQALRGGGVHLSGLVRVHSLVPSFAGGGGKRLAAHPLALVPPRPLKAPPEMDSRPHPSAVTLPPVGGHRQAPHLRAVSHGAV